MVIEIKGKSLSNNMLFPIFYRKQFNSSPEKDILEFTKSNKIDLNTLENINEKNIYDLDIDTLDVIDKATTVVTRFYYAGRCAHEGHELNFAETISELSSEDRYDDELISKLLTLVEVKVKKNNHMKA